MVTTRTKPPWQSLGWSLTWTFGGLIFVGVGLVEPTEAGTMAFGFGLLMTVLGAIALFGIYGRDLFVECRDLKERALGQQRTRYQS